MSLSREYTPRRRLVMTLVMWLLLGGTVGLAAWVSRYPAAPRGAGGMTLTEDEYRQIVRELRRHVIAPHEPPATAPSERPSTRPAP